MNDDTTAQIGLMAVAAIDLLIDAVSQIQPESWDNPSNLDDWSLRDLVGHVTGSATKIVTLAEDGELWDGPSEPADWTYDDPVGALRELATRLQDALPTADLDALRISPEGEVPLRRALTYPVSDLALHSWDIHRSQGQLVELPGDLLALCTGLVGSVPEAVLRRPGGFGPAQPAPIDSSPTSRLMAFLGRSVDDGG
ncbi:MAG: TIGR03086 family metal-binding protein [Mycobacterium sp.]|uniref:TIGR03086 family metal-binding protein n=1 Tax=Mycobacterium sp. TaxID=1785 RepID=UPI003CC6A293